MAHQHYRTKGIFLKKEDRGEADQLFTIFTEDFGKLEVLGRAIRKIKSKLRSGTGLFYFSEIEFIQGRNYKTLTDAILIDKFKDLRENEQKVAIAFQITQTADLLFGKEESDQKIWQLLLRAFQDLSICQETLACQLVRWYFLWNIFSVAGYKPELYHCAVCQKKLLPETFFFVPEEGGVVCWSCLAQLKREKEEQKKELGEKNVAFSANWREIKVDTVKLLRMFLKEPPAIVAKLKVGTRATQNLKDISEFFFCFLKESFGS